MSIESGASESRRIIIIITCGERDGERERSKLERAELWDVCR